MWSKFRFTPRTQCLIFLRVRGSASRRVNAMRLLREIPELKEDLESKSSLLVEGKSMRESI
jgi:hypothetical protein